MFFIVILNRTKVIRDYIALSYLKQHTHFQERVFGSKAKISEAAFTHLLGNDGHKRGDK